MAETVLQVRDLSFSYTQKPFMSDVAFEVKEGEMVSVIGENGSGKSTLIKAINGLVSASGEILYKGKDIKNLKALERAKEIAVIYQEGSTAFPFTCFEIVSMGLYPHKGHIGKMSKKDIEFIEHIMELTDTLSFAQRQLSTLSGGQKQRVFLARALAQKPKLLFLDEAMSGLDISGRISMTNMLSNECKKSGMAVVAVLHDINMAFDKSQRILALKNGKLYASGSPEALLNKNFFREVFNVEVDIDKSNKYFRFIL